jgi:hypothetical protein
MKPRCEDTSVIGRMETTRIDDYSACSQLGVSALNHPTQQERDDVIPATKDYTATWAGAFGQEFSCQPAQRRSLAVVLGGILFSLDTRNGLRSKRLSHVAYPLIQEFQASFAMWKTPLLHSDSSDVLPGLAMFLLHSQSG